MSGKDRVSAFITSTSSRPERSKSILRSGTAPRSASRLATVHRAGEVDSEVSAVKCDRWQILSPNASVSLHISRLVRVVGNSAKSAADHRGSVNLKHL
jgi:hypothetical protein